MKNFIKKTVNVFKSGAYKAFGGKNDHKKAVDKRVVSLGAQLCEMGFERAKVVCVAPDNSLSARLADTAVKMLSGKFIRFNSEKCDDELIELVAASGASLVFCDGNSEKLFRDNRDRLPRVKYFVCFKRKKNDGDFLSFAGTLLAGSLLTASPEMN